MKNRLSQLLFPTMLLALVGCGKEASFSLLDETDTFTQTSGAVNNKVDILWVIDNSGSMWESQENITANFSSFINDFSQKNLDFKMAVTTTDAYRSLFNSAYNRCSIFRDSILNGNCNLISGQPVSGHKVLTPFTPNLIDAFLINATQTKTSPSIAGIGDERGLLSMRTALEHVSNAGFLREDSYLSIVLVSDEDEYSHDGTNKIGNHADPNLHSLQSYVDYLDTLTLSTPENRRYNFNSMVILDEACLASITGNNQSERVVAHRFIEMTDLVNTGISVQAARGRKASLCGNFAAELQSIADGILTLSSQFVLDRVPVAGSIKVVVNGEVVPEESQNPLANGGWSFDAASNSIFFSPLYVPPAGSNIGVTYDPVSYGS